MKRELHYAIVVNNRDDLEEDLDGKKRGRLQVRCDTLIMHIDQNKDELDQEYEEEAYPVWCKPMFPFVGTLGSGWFFVPPVDSQVIIEINTDDNNMIQDVYWICGVYSNVDDIPEEFKENYPDRRGFKTPAGHVFLFDDVSGEINLMTADGRYLHMTPNGSIKTQAGDHVINMLSKEDSDTGESMIAIESFEAKSLIWLREAFIDIKQGGSHILMDSANISLSATGAVNIAAPTIALAPSGALSVTVESAGEVSIDAPSSDLSISCKNASIESIDKISLKSIGQCSVGGEDHPGILGDLIGAYIDGHLHLDSLGAPTTVPTVLMSSLAGTPTDPIAANVKLKGNE